jgi:hypothetical protein
VVWHLAIFNLNRFLVVNPGDGELHEHVHLTPTLAGRARDATVATALAAANLAVGTTGGAGHLASGRASIIVCHRLGVLAVTITAGALGLAPALAATAHNLASG